MVIRPGGKIRVQAFGGLTGMDEALEIVDSLPENDWIQFVNTQSDGNIFHTPYLYEIFRNTKNHVPRLAAVVSRSDGLLNALMLTVQVNVAGGLLKRLTGRGILYGGLLCPPQQKYPDSISRLVEMHDQKLRSHVLLTEIRNMNSTAFFRSSLEANGYVYRDYLNYVIDLQQGPERIYNSFSTSCKRNIRKAETSGIEIRVLEDLDGVPVFYRMLQKTYARAKVVIADISLFENAFRVLYPKNMIKIFVAYLGMVPIACRSVFLFKDRMYDWYAGSDPAYYKHCPNEWMVWHILRMGIQNGFRIFDFGGAGFPDEKYGVRDFKSRFGGKLVNHGRYTKIYSPLWFQISKVGYRAYQHVI